MQVDLVRTPHSEIRTSQFAILPALFRFSFWHGRLGGKAAEGRRSPKPGGCSERPDVREASWSAPALWRFGTRQMKDVFTIYESLPDAALLKINAPSR